MIKRYCGDRTFDGVVVTVDGKPLDTRIESRCFSRNGFEWSYEGAEPSQLAYALLFDHFGRTEPAEALQDRFMRAIVANFQNEWEMTSADVERALSALQ